MAIIRTQLVLDVATLVWDDTAMSGTAKRVTEPLDLLDASEHASQRPINEVAFTLNWTNDATVVGQFDIEVSNTPGDLGSFVSIKSLAVNDEAGPGVIEAATAFGFARLTYTNASGTGTLGVTSVAGKRSAGQVRVGGGGGDLELVEVIEVTGSDVQDVDFTGLDGDVDKFYILNGAVIHGDTPNAMEIELHPNLTDPTTSETSGYLVSGSAVVSGFNTAGLMYVAAATLDRISFTTFIDAESGKDRVVNSEVHLYADPFSGTQFKITQGGIWDNSADNITGLRIHASIASSIGVGSKFTLWKRKAG